MPQLIADCEDLSALVASGGTMARLRDGAVVHWSQPGDVTLIADGSVRAELVLSGSSALRVVIDGKSKVELTTRDGCRPRAEMAGHAEVHLNCHSTSAPSIRGTAYSRLLAYAFDASRPQIDVSDFCIYTLFVHDQARPYCTPWPSTWEARGSDIYVGQQVWCYESEAEAVAVAHDVHRIFGETGSRFATCMRVRGAVPRLCRNVVDVRWTGGTVHVELQDEAGGAWYSPDAHDHLPLTEIERSRCTKHFFNADRKGDV